MFGCFRDGSGEAACLMNADGSDVGILIDEPDENENHFSWGATAQ